jgi:hypothetical protein
MYLEAMGVVKMTYIFPSESIFENDPLQPEVM